MLLLLSPAKTLDLQPPTGPHTQPRLLEHTQELADQLRAHSPAQLGTLMSISDKLADLNYERYQNFRQPFTPANASHAVSAFRGDVYQDLEADSFTEAQHAFADRHLRILSGLYGLLRPRDLMQAYRLEMGTRLRNARGRNLYEFWGDRITDLLAEDLAEDGSGVLLNLASQEYFKAIRTERLEGRVLNLHFKERKNGKLRVVAFNAKRARGRMANLIIREEITTPEPLTELVANDYVFDAELSSENDWVYVR